MGPLEEVKHWLDEFCRRERVIEDVESPSLRLFFSLGRLFDRLICFRRIGIAGCSAVQCRPAESAMSFLRPFPCCHPFRRTFGGVMRMCENVLPRSNCSWPLLGRRLRQDGEILSAEEACACRHQIVDSMAWLSSFLFWSDLFVLIFHSRPGTYAAT